MLYQLSYTPMPKGFIGCKGPGYNRNARRAGQRLMFIHEFACHIDFAAAYMVDPTCERAHADLARAM